jgi:hypothetical protein
MRRNGRWIAALFASAFLIAAGGCTGSQILDTGNSGTRFEIVAAGVTTQDFDCALFQLAAVRLFPLDGTCDVESTNAGEPCFISTSCIGGTCEGSSAADIIAPVGLFVVDAATNVKGNLYGTVCDAATFPFLNATVGAEPFINPAPFVLSSGLYEISQMRFTFVGLYKDGSEFPQEPPVPDELDLRVCTNLTNVVAQSGGPLRFTVDAASPKVVQFEVRADALETYFENTGSETSNCLALNEHFEDIFVCTTCDASVAPSP